MPRGVVGHDTTAVTSLGTVGLRRTLAVLTSVALRPSRLVRRGGLWNTILAAPLRKQSLLRQLRLVESQTEDGITVIVPVRNRPDCRLVNALRSVRLQDYPQERIATLVVDYGSNERCASRTAAMCRDFQAKYLWVPIKGPWSRAHASNIGIRRARTKFVLSTDADILFARNYFSEAVKALKDCPLSVVYSQCLDLPESCTEDLTRSARDGVRLDLDALREKAICRRAGGVYDSAGINASYTLFYHLVRGYDEHFTCYGAEDRDLERRFWWLGLSAVSLRDRSYYLHQWHSDRERIPDEEYRVAHEANDEYAMTARSIYRNRRGWGSDQQS